MKKFFVVLAILAMMVFPAGFALAGDAEVGGDGTAIGFDSTNTNTSTNANANTNNLNQAQTQGQSSTNTNNSAATASNGDQTTTVGGQSTNVEIQAKREFLAAPGFTDFLGSGIALRNDEWRNYCPPVYQRLSMKEIDNMKRKFRLSDIFPWNWKEGVHVIKIGESLASNTDDVMCVNYWPKHFAYSGDKVLATARILGDPNWPEEAYLGMSESACKDISGSRRVAMRVRIHTDGVTIGRSFGLSGAAAKVAEGGTGTAFAAGGQLGNNRTKVEDYVEFEILCMNDGPTEWIIATPSPTGIELESKPVCDADEIRGQIRQHEEEIKECKLFSFHNLQLRVSQGDNYVDLYLCTGDKNYLKAAIREYEIAERNYLRGHDIRVRQAEANSIIAHVYYNWAGCIYELHGRKAAMKFAKAKKLERIPTGFAK